MAYSGGPFTISLVFDSPPPFLLSLFLVCIDVKWGRRVSIFLALDLAYSLILLFCFFIISSYYMHDSVI